MKEKTLSDKVRFGSNEGYDRVFIYVIDVKQFIKEILDEIERIFAHLPKGIKEDEVKELKERIKQKAGKELLK